jgi:hypothetical protein
MNKNLSQKFIAYFFAVCSLILALHGCHRETDADKIKKVITNVQKAAEEKDVKKILDVVSKTYQDPQGFDFDSIKGLLLGYFFRHQKVHVYIPDIDISVEDSSAKAVFQTVLTGGDRTGSASDILPDALGMYAFYVSFRREAGEWKVTSARWNRVGEEGR